MDLSQAYKRLSEDPIFADAIGTQEQFEKNMKEQGFRELVADMFSEEENAAIEANMQGPGDPPKKKSSDSGSTSQSDTTEDPFLKALRGSDKKTTSPIFDKPQKSSIRIGESTTLTEPDKTTYAGKPVPDKFTQAPDYTAGKTDVPKPEVLNTVEQMSTLKQEGKIGEGETALTLGLSKTLPLTDFSAGELLYNDTELPVSKPFTYRDKDGNVIQTQNINEDVLRGFYKGQGLNTQQVENKLDALSGSYISKRVDDMESTMMNDLFAQENQKNPMMQNKNYAAANERYQNIMNHRAMTFLPDDVRKWFIMNKLSYDALVDKIEAGKELNPKEMRDFTRMKGELMDYFGTDKQVYDPVTGKFVWRGQESAKTKAITEKVSKIMAQYEKSDRGALQRARDKKILEYEILKNQFSQLKGDTQQGDTPSDWLNDMNDQPSDLAYSVLHPFGLASGKEEMLRDKLYETEATILSLEKAIAFNVDPTGATGASDISGFTRQLGRELGFGAYIPDSRKEEAATYITALRDAGVDVSQEQQNAIEQTFGEQLSSSLGSSVAIMIPTGQAIGLLKKAGRGIKFLAALDDMAMAASQERFGTMAGEGIWNLTKQIGQNALAFELTGQGATTGAGEAVGASAFEALAPPMKLLKPVSKFFTRLAGGAVGETFEEYSGDFLQSLKDNDYDIAAAAKITFGSDWSEAGQKLALIALSSAIFSAAPEAINFYEDVYSTGKRYMANNMVPVEFQEFMKVLDDNLIAMKKAEAAQSQANDQENQQGVPGQVQQGQEPIQTQPDQTTGPEATPAGGVLQTQEEVNQDIGSQINQPLSAQILYNNKSTKSIDQIIQEYGKVPERLSQEEEQGRVAGGSINVEATIVAERASVQNGQGNDRSTESAKQQEQTLKEYAIENNLWMEDYKSELGQTPDQEGGEAEVYLSPSGDKVVKVKSADQYSSPLDFLDSITIWNFLFPESAYTLRGFTEKNGKLAFIIEQPTIHIERSATRDEIFSELSKIGFDTNRASRFSGARHPELDIWLRDLNEGNVVIGTDGRIYFIDAVLHTNEKQRGLGGNKKINTTNYPKPDMSPSAPQQTGPQTNQPQVDMMTSNTLTGTAKNLTPEQKDAVNKLIDKLKSVFPNSSVQTFEGTESTVTVNGEQKIVGEVISSKQGAPIETMRGVVYGFRVGDQIFLNEKVLDMEAPIHEYAHIWVSLLKGQDKAMYDQAVALVKQYGQKYIDWVKNAPAYSDYSEERVLEEALVKAIGEKGVQMENRTAIDKLKEWFDGVIEKIKQALGMSSANQDMPFSQFLKGAVTDIMSEKGKMVDKTQSSTPNLDMMSQNLEKTDQEVLNDYNTLKNTSVGKTIPDIVEEMLDEGYDAIQIKNAVGSAEITPDVLQQIYERRAVKVMTENAARWNALKTDAANILNAGGNSTMSLEWQRQLLLSRGIPDLIIYNTFLERGASAQEMTSLFGSEFTETIDRIADAGAYDAFGIQKLTGEPEAYRFSQNIEMWREVFRESEGVDSMAMMEYVISQMQETGFQSNLYDLIDEIRSAIKEGRPLAADKILAARKAGSMMGRCLAMFRNIVHRDPQAFADAIIQSIEERFDKISKEWVPTGRKLTDGQKARIKNQVEAYQTALREKRALVKQFNESAAKGALSDDFLMSFSEEFGKKDAELTKASRMLNTTLSAMKLPIWAEWLVSTSTKSLLSLRSMTLGIHGNLEHRLFRKISDPLAIGFDAALGKLFGTDRTMFFSTKERKVLKTIRKAKTRDEVISTLKYGFQFNPDLMGKYTEVAYDYNPFKELHDGFAAIWPLIKSKITGSSDQEVAEKLGMLVKEANNGTLTTIDGKSAAILGKVIRGMFGVIPELSVRSIALSGDRQIYNRVWMETMVDYAIADRRRVVEEAKRELAATTDKKRKEELTAKIKQLEQPISNTEIMSHVLNNMDQIHNDKFFASKEAAREIFINDNLIAKWMISFKQGALSRSRALKEEDHIAKAQGISFLSKYRLGKNGLRVANNLMALAGNVVSPFTRIPTNVIDRFLQFYSPAYNVALAAIQSGKLAALSAEHKKNYGEHKILNPSQIRHKKELEQKMFDTQRRASYSVAHWVVSLTLAYAADAIFYSGSLIPPSGDDEESKKILKQLRINPGSVNLTMLMSNGKIKTHEPDHEYIGTNNMGIFGMILGSRGSQGALQFATGKLYKNHIDEVFFQNGFATFASGIMSAIQNLPMARGGAAVQTFIQDLSNTTRNTNTSKAMDLFVNAIKVTISPLTPNLLSFIDRGENYVYDDLDGLYLDLETGEKYGELSRAFTKAWTAMSTRLPDFMSSPYLDYEIGMFGEKIRRPRQFNDGMGNYLMGIFDPFGMGTIEKNDMSTLKFMMFNMARMQNEKFDDNNPIFRTIFPRSMEMMSVQHPSGVPHAPEVTIPIPYNMYKEYLKFRGENLYQILSNGQAGEMLKQLYSNLSSDEYTVQEKNVMIDGFTDLLNENIKGIETEWTTNNYQRVHEWYKTRYKQGKISDETLRKLEEADPNTYKEATSR